MEKVKVTIDGIDYSLTSENSLLLNKAVNIVDSEIKNIKERYKYKINNETVNVLTSLNIAENMLSQEIENEQKEKSLNTKLNKLVQQLENILN